MNQQGLLLIASGIGRVFKIIGFLLGVIANRVGCIFLSVGFVFESVFTSVLLRGIAGHCAEAEECGAKKDYKGFHLHSLVCLIRFNRFPHSIALTVPPRITGLWRASGRFIRAVCQPPSRIPHDPDRS